MWTAVSLIFAAGGVLVRAAANSLHEKGWWLWRLFWSLLTAKEQKQFGKTQVNEDRHLSFGQFAAGLVVVARERWVLGALVAASGKNNVSLFLHLYFTLVAASGQKRISLANLWSPLARGKDTCNVHSLFSAWNTCVLFLSIYSAHKQGKKEERAKESHFLLIFEESKSVRRYVGHWSDPLLETKTKLNPLNRNLFQWVLEILTNTSSICICTVSNTDLFSILFWSL